jgi:hypothetical protein
MLIGDFLQINFSVLKLFCQSGGEGRYPETLQIGKEMSSLYFGFDVFCQFEDIVLEFETVYICIAFPVFRGRGYIFDSYGYIPE